jgi:type IV secretory pathway VirB10-like protein
MPVLRIVLLVLVVGGLTLFALFNLSPVLPLVFLGSTTVALPLGTWIGIAIAAGAGTSFFLQLLSYLSRGYSPRRVEAVEELDDNQVPPRTRSFEREPEQTPEPEPETRYTPPPPPPPATPKPPRRDSDTLDWEERVSKDWDFEEEPTAPRANQSDFDFDDSSNPQAAGTNYEVKQEPKTSSQSGSVYSYTYREHGESGVGKADAIYDANYRLITPPYQPTYQQPVESDAESDEDDEDWGFEDDDDFEFEDDDDKRPRRR